MNGQRDRSATSRSRIRLPLVVLAVFLPGCGGIQSALNPAGRAAEDIAHLFFGMTIGGGVIWAIVVGLAVYAIRSAKAHDAKMTSLLVIGGGAVVPTVVLTVLLCFGLRLLPELQTPPPKGSLVIDVQGERFWWRVRYSGDETVDGAATGYETANEVVLPVNEPVDFRLTTADVIHSFWIPSLGGKMDMMPGRQTRLKLHPTSEGTFRGACAEYCGTAHADMAFDVRVVSREEFDAWLIALRQPASDLASNGRRVFEARGCGACHAIRGTRFDGHIGPDLTHVGSRKSLGAGVVRNDVAGFVRWIRETHDAKPGANMPPFETLSDEDLQALATYLKALR